MYIYIYIYIGYTARCASRVYPGLILGGIPPSLNSPLKIFGQNYIYFLHYLLFIIYSFLFIICNAPM